MQFLVGLNSCYDHVKSQILVIESLPSLDKTYSMLSILERQNKVSNSKAIEMVNVAVVSSVNFSNTQRPASEGPKGYIKIDKSGLKCNYCNGTKHTRKVALNSLDI